MSDATYCNIIIMLGFRKEEECSFSKSQIHNMVKLLLGHI